MESNGRAAFILGANDLAREAIAVPQWGTDLHIREWTGAEREQIEKAAQDSKANLTPLVVCLSLCDQYGARIFADADLTALEAKNAKILDKVALASWKFNGMPLGAEAPGKEPCAPSAASGSS